MAHHVRRDLDACRNNADGAAPRETSATEVGELERYEDSYGRCYVRGPEGITIEPAAQIGLRASP